jgi:hypothetical protein
MADNIGTNHLLKTHKYRNKRGVSNTDMKSNKYLMMVSPSPFTSIPSPLAKLSSKKISQSNNNTDIINSNTNTISNEISTINKHIDHTENDDGDNENNTDIILESKDMITNNNTINYSNIYQFVILQPYSDNPILITIILPFFLIFYSIYSIHSIFFILCPLIGIFSYITMCFM